ncbi:hypothetical protein AJ87_03890 [Rhizobium yanglingense]|nr:hypothetical protein AJ87_03890 [Rhizobium yanglingense]
MADNGVVAFLRSVHTAVIDVERQRDFGVRCQKRIEGRTKMHATEGDRCCNTQGTGKRTAALGHIGCGLFYLMHDPKRTLHKGGAVLRQRQLRVVR